MAQANPLPNSKPSVQDTIFYRWANAVNDLNLAAILDCYAPDAHILATFSSLAANAAERTAYFENLAARPGFGVHYEEDEVEVMPTTDSRVQVIHGFYTFHNKVDDILSDTRAHLTIISIDDKIIAHHSSAVVDNGEVETREVAPGTRKASFSQMTRAGVGVEVGFCDLIPSTGKIQKGRYIIVSDNGKEIHRHLSIIPVQPILVPGYRCARDDSGMTGPRLEAPAT